MTEYLSFTVSVGSVTPSFPMVGGAWVFISLPCPTSTFAVLVSIISGGFGQFRGWYKRLRSLAPIQWAALVGNKVVHVQTP